MHVTRTRAGIAAAALAAVGLTAVPASAQTLSGFVAGDSVTVNANGTHGTLAGAAVNNSTTTYTATAAPGAAVALNAGAFTLGPGGTLSGGATSDGLDVGLSTLSVGSSTVPGTGTVTITGGTITGFDAVNVGGGTVTITGGLISTPVPATGAGLVAQVSTGNPTTGGVINLYGRNFLVNGLPAPASLTVTTGTLTGLVSGTLSNGDALNTNYQLVGTGATINFNPAPEPSQYAALGLGGAGLAGLALKARRRRPVA